MTTPGFVQYFASNLYLLANPGPTPGWVGFVSGEDAPYPANIGLDASFNNGYYLFAPAAPALSDNAAAQEYVDTLQICLDQAFGTPTSYNGSACIWIPDTSGPPQQAELYAILFDTAGGGGVFTSNNFNLSICQLGLSLPQQLSVSWTGTGLSFDGIGSAGPSFDVVQGDNAPSLNGGVGLPLLGPYAGALTLQGAISRSGSPGALAYFQTGFQYLFKDQDGADQLQAYPAMLSGPDLPDLPFVGAVDPLDLFNNVPALSDPAQGRYRTLFALACGAPLPSWYRTTLGQPVGLLPVEQFDSDGLPAPYAGALVLQSCGRESLSVYLTLAGDYALATAALPAGQPVLLLPGLAGSECFQMRSYASGTAFDRLRFVPGQPAYAPVFPFQPSSLADPTSSVPAARLDGTVRTAWAAVVSGETDMASYLAQPQGSPLYAPALPVDSDRLLRPLATPSPITRPTLMPFVPYAGLAVAQLLFPSGVAAVFESQILSAERKRLLAQHSLPRLAAQKRRARAAVAAPLRQATTAQGLYAEIALPGPAGGQPESEYKTVLLACSNARSPASGNVPFGFTNLSAPLQDLFQTNQLMAVIVDPTELLAGFAPHVVIADWGMTANVGAAPSTSGQTNILLLKYCAGTLYERLQNPNKWTGVDAFSKGGQGDQGVGLAALSSYLKAYLDEAIANSADGNTLYDNFSRIVQDPTWQGFLVLRASVDPANFPDQLKGLVAGIDFTRFEAHHFGVTASHVTVQDGTVTMQQPSSLFGLIDYQLPAFAQNIAGHGSPDMPLSLPLAGDFGFSVLQLQALFENAALRDFRSRVQLSVGTLFGSDVQIAYGAAGRLPTSAVVLRGTYQRQGASPVYAFEQNATTVFALDSNALPSVALDRVLFNTLSNGDDGTIRSRFLIWGTFNFALLAAAPANGAGGDPADLLSFGLDVGDPLYGTAQGLRFSGLDISLSSPLATPSALCFDLDTGRLALDAGASTARENSLYRDLALEVDSFVSGTAERRPIDFGFLPVTAEPLLQAWTGPWYGIACKVNMGSPGALVANAGFSSRILLAWSPASRAAAAAASVFIGLQLPGAAPGAKLLSIQGVLKLAIDALVLRREAVVASAPPAFVLRLSNIGLSILGIVKLPADPINFFLFGDPSGTGSLGWYAAYQDAPAPKQSTGDHGP